MEDTFEAYCEGLKSSAPNVYRSLCDGQHIESRRDGTSIVIQDESPETEIVPGKVWRKTVTEEGTNAKYIVERNIDHVSKKQYTVTLRPINFKSGTKTIAGKSGKTYTVPILMVPAGSFLYRGVKAEPGTETMLTEYPSGTWFSWAKQTASGYHTHSIQLEDKTYLDVLTFKVTSDLELLDLWTSVTWESILAEVGSDDAALRSFAGISRTAAKTDYLAKSKKTGMFPGSTCVDDACQEFNWRGLRWGPKSDQYKRKSEDVTDLAAIETIYSAFPGGFDGIFAFPTPSDASRYPGFTNPILYGVFHEEINIRPGRSGKLEYIRKTVRYGGKKTRRKHKKSKQTRTSKKK